MTELTSQWWHYKLTFIFRRPPGNAWTKKVRKVTSWLRTPTGTNPNTEKLQLDSYPNTHPHKHTHTQNDQRSGRAHTQCIPWKTPEEATAGATQNRTGATRLSTFYPPFSPSEQPSRYFPIQLQHKQDKSRSRSNTTSTKYQSTR